MGFDDDVGEAEGAGLGDGASDDGAGAGEEDYEDAEEDFGDYYDNESDFSYGDGAGEGEGEGEGAAGNEGSERIVDFRDGAGAGDNGGQGEGDEDEDEDGAWGFEEGKEGFFASFCEGADSEELRDGSLKACDVLVKGLDDNISKTHLHVDGVYKPVSCLNGYPRCVTWALQLPHPHLFFRSETLRYQELAERRDQMTGKWD